MRYREGYERYGELFELVAKTTRQSCLLLTSREKPRAIANALVRKRADFITALEQDCFHQGFLIKRRKVTQVILILN